MLTSKAFIEKGKLDKLIAAIAGEARVVYLEDIRAGIGFADKIAGLLAGTTPRVARNADDPAVVLFTSGSEGTPKGVVLSHRNILANAAQALARVDANANDKVFNVLPVFHSFGLTGGHDDAAARRHPDLHVSVAAALPDRARTDLPDRRHHPVRHRYFPHRLRPLGACLRLPHACGWCSPARKPSRTAPAQVYMERYGIRILEGYGVTETAPVLAMNTPMANRPGTVGRLSPLMEYRLDPVPGIEEGGRLSVRGPNVMLGYLRAENPGVLEPLPDGWHDTGDIVSIDAAGFITIKGRAKRFAKIAGEMVSLSAVEAMAAALWPQAISVAVSIPDQRKGERIVLLTTAEGRQPRRDAAPGQGVGDIGTCRYPPTSAWSTRCRCLDRARPTTWRRQRSPRRRHGQPAAKWRE